MMERHTQINIWYFILAFLAVMWLRDVWVASQHVEEISYSQFEEALKQGRIEQVAIRAGTLRGTYKAAPAEAQDAAAEAQDARADGQTAPAETPHQFVTPRVDLDLARELEQYDVEFTGVIESTFFSQILSWVVPALVFIAIWMYVVPKLAAKQGGGMGGMMSIGKSKAKVYMEKDTKVTFDDVAGVDEAKRELQEIVEFLKEPQRYGRLGARAPKGVLLVGPPGTGKTLLARAVAGEAGVPFFSISGSEFVEMFVGVGAARVRDLFEQARQKAPAIIFIDELDAVGRARGISPLSGGGHDEKEQTLNQLLSELDGFDPSAGLILLAATNRPEILDPALLRAGRFDRQVLVDRPDKAGRIQILHVHLKKVRLAPDVDPEQIAGLTPGFSGADLANLVNESALLATRRGGEAVALTDFTEAVERIVAGLEKRNRLLNPFERGVVAHHEMGHALVAMSLSGVDPVHKVSIIPRGIGSLGYTIQRPLEDRFLMTREELEKKLTVLLGGRAAERLIFGHVSTGAADDLAKATDIARSMVTRYGMDERLGHATYEVEQHRFLDLALPRESHQLSEETTRTIDASVRDIVNGAFERALALLKERRSVLEAGARKLLQQETLDQSELATLQNALPLAAAVFAAAPQYSGG
jgi:cell division protease FtsH